MPGTIGLQEDIIEVATVTRSIIYTGLLLYLHPSKRCIGLRELGQPHKNSRVDYCTITTICSRGVTRDGVNTFEQVFTAYKSVQIRCIFGRAAEILKFRCAFGHF